MKTYENIVSYWRNSLADAMRMDIDKTKMNEAIVVSKDAIASGKISFAITKEIFEKDTDSKNESNAKSEG